MRTRDEATEIERRLDHAAAAARWHLPRVVVHHVRRGVWQIGWYLVDVTPGGTWQVTELVRSSTPWGAPVTTGPVLFDATDPESAVIDAAGRALEEVMAAAVAQEADR